jgi:hypothetical protein
MSDVLTAISIAADLMQAAARMAASAQAVSAIIVKAQSEGRDLTPEEWAQIKGADDQARDNLQAAIEARKG